jgi:2-oxoglutarate dehydrogenase E2 component (dihydrolipoamide succinyltransferase)
MTVEDMAGGTFTISNGGIYGSLMGKTTIIIILLADCTGTPIINLPQTAVLGLHAAKERPVVVKGQIVIRPIMYLGITHFSLFIYRRCQH